MACWMCKCEGKVRPPSGFPPRDLGNNPLLWPYLLLSLKHERTSRGQQLAAMSVLCKLRLSVSVCFIKKKSGEIKMGDGQDNSV